MRPVFRYVSIQVPITVVYLINHERLKLTLKFETNTGQTFMVNIVR